MTDATGTARTVRSTPDWIILTIACVAQFMVVLDSITDLERI
jgi:hypothetical protein